MTRRLHEQTGSMHAIIISLFVVALIGALGVVFWQNFVTKNSKGDSTTQVDNENKTTPAKEEVMYNTYQTDTHPVSFKYPATWALTGAQADNQNGFYRSINVTTDTGDKATFSVGGQGIGGTCGGTLPTYTTLEAVTTTLTAAKPVAMSFTVITNEDGTLEGYYGLTDTYTEKKSGDVCTFYYLFDSGSDIYKLVSFNGTKKFKDMADVNRFVGSVEYAAIKKMILSLRY
jgi:cytoskeletal protein RodZ